MTACKALLRNFFVFEHTGADNNWAKGQTQCRQQLGERVYYTEDTKLIDCVLGRPVPATTGRKGALHRGS